MSANNVQSSRRNFLKHAAGIGAALSGLVPVSAFANSSFKRSKNKHLSFFGFKVKAFQLSAIEKALYEYMTMHPGVNVSYESVNESLYHRVLRLRAKSGNLDDLFMVSNEDQANLVEREYLEDLSSCLPVSMFEDPLRTQFLREDGTIYHVPMNISFYGLFINMKMLGVNHIGIPRNYQEFADICNFFKSKGVLPVLGNNFDFLHCIVYSKAFYPILKGMPFKSSVLREFNEHPEDFSVLLMDGLAVLKEMRDNDWISPYQVLGTSPYDMDIQQFLRGESPFLFSNGGKANYVYEHSPKFLFRIKPFPILEDGWILPIRGDTNLSVNSQSDKKEEVKALLTFLLNPKILREYCYSQTGFLPYKNPELPEDFFLRECRTAINNRQIVSYRDFRMNHRVNEALVEAAREILAGSTQKAAYRILEKRLCEPAGGPLFYA